MIKLGGFMWRVTVQKRNSEEINIVCFTLSELKELLDIIDNSKGDMQLIRLEADFLVTFDEFKEEYLS